MFFRIFFYPLVLAITWAAHMHIIQEGAEVRSWNEDIVTNVSFHTDRINETLVTLNYQMSLKRDLKDAYMYIKYDGWINNEWVRTDLIDFDFTFCELYNDADLNIFRPCMTDGVRGNFPTDCPDGVMVKNDYFISQCFLDESVNMTLFLPGRWRVNIDYYDGDETEICHLYLYMNCQEVV